MRHSRDSSWIFVPFRKSSLTRTARGQDHEPEASLCGQRGSRGFDSIEHRWDIPVGQGTEVRLYGWHRGQRAVDGLSRDVLRNGPVRPGPAQDRADPLPDSPGRFRAGSPYRRQDGQHVGTLDAVDAQVAEDREGVAFERLHPGVRMLGIPPARLEHRVGPAAGH